MRSYVAIFSLLVALGLVGSAHGKNKKMADMGLMKGTYMSPCIDGMRYYFSIKQYKNFKRNVIDGMDEGNPIRGATVFYGDGDTNCTKGNEAYVQFYKVRGISARLPLPDGSFSNDLPVPGWISLTLQDMKMQIAPVSKAMANSFNKSKACGLTGWKKDQAREVRSCEALVGVFVPVYNNYVQFDANSTLWFSENWGDQYVFNATPPVRLENSFHFNMISKEPKNLHEMLLN